MSIKRYLAQLFSRRQTSLLVPERFNRNSPKVTALMTPEQSGRWLLERMRQHIGFASYDRVSLLDFGCGVRFSQSILNTQFDIGSYAGVDNYRELIEFLQTAVWDPRFSFAFLDAHHAMYNPAGHRIEAQTMLPFQERSYDVVSMFSVITHQDPTQAVDVFALLRKYVKPDGHLFFTCFLDDSIETFEDRSPPGLTGERCYYNGSYMKELIERGGWTPIRQSPNEAPLIGDSFVCAPR